MRSRCWLFVAVAVLASVGCTDDKAPEPPPDAGSSPGGGRAKLRERARVLEPRLLEALSSVQTQGERVELAFDASSAAELDQVQVGDVLILGPSEKTPRGALLEVETVTERDSRFVMLARRAALRDAFEELNLHLAVTLEEAAETDGALEMRNGVARSQQALGLTFPIAFSESGFELDGSLSLESSVGIELDFDITELELNELSLRFDAQQTFFAQLRGEGAFAINESITVGSIGFTPITIYVPIPSPPGAVPVVLTPGVELSAGVAGNAQGALEAAVSQQAAFSAGLGYIDGEFQGVSDSDSQFDAEQPSYEAGATLRAYGGPRLEILIYDAVGPYVRADAFLELSASAGGPPPCASGVLNAGLAAHAGVDFLADFETSLFERRYPVGQFDTCSDDPEAPRPAITWARSFGRVDSAGEIARAVIEASDGTFLVAGDSSLFAGINAFAASAWVLRLDALGNVIWERAFQRTDLGLVRGVAEVPGGFLIAGTSGVMKLDPGGNPLWARRYTADTLLEVASIAARDDGSFVVAGFHGTSVQAFAMGLDARGEPVWSRVYAADEFTRVRATADGGYVLAALLAGTSDAAVVKIDAQGEVEWARRLDNPFETAPDEPESARGESGDRAFDVAERPGGGYVVAGEAYGPFPLPEPTPVGYYATWIAELDAQGELAGAGSQLHRVPSESLYGGAYAVVVRPNGSTLAIGRRADSATDLLSNEDVLVIQGNGYALLGGGGNDAVEASGNSRGTPLALTADGGAVMAVTSNSFAGQEQFWVVKLNRAGSIGSDYRRSVSGSSFSNPDATSLSFEADPRPVEVGSELFTSELNVEATGVEIVQQDPRGPAI